MNRSSSCLVRSLKAAVLACFAAFSIGASASHSLTTVDAIDGSFSAGGGVVTGSLAGGGDDGYLVFQGAAGDLVIIRMDSSAFDPFLYLFLDNSGAVNVGDAVNITSTCAQGAGADVTFLACDDNAGPGVSGALISLALPTDGQYLIGATSTNDVGTGSYRLELLGNTLDVAQVPTPGTLALLAIGLLGFPLWRLRQRAPCRGSAS